MGSFIVTVVGENPEQQMLKYSSFRSAQIPNPYVTLHDITQQLKEQSSSNTTISVSDFLREACEELCINELKSGEKIDTYGDHYNGYFTVDNTGNVDSVFEYKNPNEECDGFSLGYGWAGFYFVKPGGSGIAVGIPRKGTVVRPDTADMVLKGAIDFERMMKEAGNYAGTHYDAFYALVNKYNNILEDDFDKEFFDGQKSGTFPMYASVYDYEQERSHFVKLREYYAISSYAFIIDGEINKSPHSIGRLPPKEEISWLESIWSKLFSLPDDTVFTLYHCHE